MHCSHSGLLLLALCSLAPLGAHAGDPVVSRGDVTAASDRPPLDDPALAQFFAPTRNYPLRSGDALWLDVADGLTIVFDADDAEYNFVMQYDYALDRVVNVVRFHNRDHATIVASFNHFAARTRGLIDHSEYGSRLRIKTPRPDPPPVGRYWVGFESQVRQIAGRHR